MEKTIFHMDGDAFFVGVEVAKNPKLRGLPVVTGGERGIVSALSYEAKALGITRGMPIFRLKKEFPQVIVMSGDYRSYAEYSQMMFDIVRRYIDDVEEYSIDECFGDLTGLELPLRMSYREIAEHIKQEIAKELGLSVSIGIAPTKVLAKLASKWIKPNGLTIIDRDKISDFLIKTPIEKIWGIGSRTSDSLRRMGVSMAYDFINKDINWVKDNFSKPYEIIWYELNGKYLIEIDSKPKTEYSSIQRTRSFHPVTNDKIFLLSQLSKHIEDACMKARHYSLFSKRFTFFLKTRDFKYITYSCNLFTPTNTPETFILNVQKYFDKVYKKGVMYRTVGFVLQELSNNSFFQPDLFGNSEKISRFEKIHKQIDSLEDKYGKKVVYLASTHNARKQDVKGTEMDDLDRNLLFL